MTIKPIDHTIGQRIRSLRRAKDMTQRALAERLDVSDTLIQAYECARIRIAVSTLAEIAIALDTTMGELVEGL